jgi:predicted RNase H-like HicB family nuclease
MKLTAVITEEPDTSGAPGYVALCPELDVASQGDTQDEAFTMLQEAVSLFLEDADPEELRRRMTHSVSVREFEVAA